MQIISGLVLLSSSSHLRAKLHGFLRDGLELVVSSPVHVEIILDDRVKEESVGGGSMLTGTS